MVAFYGRWGSFDWFFSLATFDLFSTLLKFDIHFNKWKNFVSLVLDTSVPKKVESVASHGRWGSLHWS